MERKKALQIMGLNETCSEKEIKSKYKVFLKQEKSGEDINLQEITKAYNELMGLEKYERLDVNSKSFKIRKFLFHYLSYIIIFIGIISLLLWMFVPKLTEEKPDLSVSFVGSFYLLESEKLETQLYKNINDLEKVVVEIIYLDKNSADGEYDKAGRVRLAGTIISGQADIFVEDDENFTFMVSEGVLMPLDDIIPLLNMKIEPSRYIYGVDEQGNKWIYGIDVSYNKIILQTAYGNTIRILSIAKETEHFDKVIKGSNIILEED